VTASWLVFFSARRLHRPLDMRGDEQPDDPKKPRPTDIRKKGTNAVEGDESGEPLRKDSDRDHHRHVC
jgi:hypothetical protein